MILEVENLKVYFPIKSGVFTRTTGWVKAVDGVSLGMEVGETLGLVGESGSGKSTLARVIAGLQKPTEGKVAIGGKVAMVFQDPLAALNPRQKVGSMLAEALRHVKRRANREAVERLLDDVGLEHEVYERYPHEFSGGQRQRLCIARAIALEPKILICDEAVSALDLSIRAQILELLAKLKEKMGLSILFITHDLGVVKHIAERVLVMNRGKLVANDSEYAKKLIAAVPRIREGMRNEK